MRLRSMIATTCGLLALVSTSGLGTADAVTSPPAKQVDSSALFSVSALSPDDAWAVGHDGNHALIEHWDGTRWTRSPVTAKRRTSLLSVSATSASDAWAVGYSLVQGGLLQPFVAHWDGVSWTQQAFPPLYDSALTSVSALSPTDVWVVVGWWSAARSYHWDGRTWHKRSPVHPHRRGFAVFASVAALSPDLVWASGELDKDPSIFPMTQVWTSDGWRLVRTPAPRGATATQLWGIDGASPDLVWSVGSSFGTYDRAVIERWDGSRWSIAYGRPSDLNGRLQGVSAASDTDAWAVGAVWTAGSFELLLMHWDGSAWSRVPGLVNADRQPCVFCSLQGVDAVSSTDAWTVGMVQVGADTVRPVILHWDGVRWTNVPAAT